MQRLTIAVDCDDVLLPSVQSIIDIYNRKYGTAVAYKDAYSTDVPQWQAAPEQITERIFDIQLSSEYTSVKPFAEAVEVCSRLARWHSLYLVTARPDSIMTFTLAMIDQHFPDVFSEIEHIGLDGNKGDVCHLLQADVLIDDRHKHLRTAYDRGIENLLWFGDYPWQYRGAEDEMGLIVCPDWQEVEAQIERIAN